MFLDSAASGICEKDGVLLNKIVCLAHGSICSLYFEMHVTYILKFQKIETKNSNVHLHVLRAHKVVS